MKSSDSLGFLLHDVSRQMRAAFDARTRDMGVTRPQWRLLLILAKGGEGRTQAELADRLDVERITLCRMIDRLVEAGMVERRADPADRRVWRIHLMPAAHDITGKLTKISAELEEEMLALLAPADHGRLIAALTTLREGLRARADERTDA